MDLQRKRRSRHTQSRKMEPLGKDIPSTGRKQRTVARLPDADIQSGKVVWLQGCDHLCRPRSDRIDRRQSQLHRRSSKGIRTDL